VFQLFGIHREGFLAEDPLSILETHQSGVVMPGMEDRDVDDVDLWIFSQFFIRAVSSRDVEFRCKVLGRVQGTSGNCHCFDITCKVRQSRAEIGRDLSTA